MAADTTVFQDMADAMLPLFDNMSQVVVLVEDSEWFQRDPFPLAVYSCPNILINPSHARTCNYDEMQGTICHELIHAWLHWKGLDRAVELVDDSHNERFLQKALEINKKKIDGLNVDVEHLLTSPKGVDIYNRVAGVRFAPYLRHKVRRIRRAVVAYATVLFQFFGVLYVPSKKERFSRVSLISFAVVLTSVILNKAHLISDAVVSFTWWGWALACLVWYALILILQRTR